MIMSLIPLVLSNFTLERETQSLLSSCIFFFFFWPDMIKVFVLGAVFYRIQLKANKRLNIKKKGAVFHCIQLKANNAFMHFNDA